MKIRPIGSDEEISRAALLNGMATAFDNYKSLALWKLPGEQQVNFVLGGIQENPVHDIGQQGFLIAPYDNQQKAYLVEHDANLLEHKNANNKDLNWYLNPVLEQGPDKDAYKKIARYAVEQVKAGSFDKVVVVRKKEASLPYDFDPLLFFEHLIEQYPDAFVSLISTPYHGTWIGASPETLVEFGPGYLNTTAVAGTKLNEEDADFSEKEQNEQELVSTYVESCFEDLAIDYSKEGPITVKAGNLTHLRTDFKASLQEAEKPPWQQLVNQLHPTPAVGGYPKNTTQIFIRNEEPFDRRLYSGFLGPVNDEAKGHLYVNLRCMEVHESNQASLYAGAGIVKGSKAEEEWDETEAKMNTLLNMLH